jgi:glyoxylase-like metal-dependent hydrolase (beta-lactamase superfamily II)
MSYLHRIRGVCRLATVAVATALSSLTASTQGAPSQAPPAVEHYRLVPGFLPEVFNDGGMALGTGFAGANPWGAYTSYLLATNARGQRTWRIEHYLPNPTSGTAQGSTMYLFEGNTRALLVDTAQNTPDVPGQNDLKTVVRHLLGHENDGRPRASAVDFVVANTHSHGDHTGKNGTMADRTVYYPDLDWPRANAPANYTPIKEGGGASANGGGQAVGEIDLGARRIEAISLYAHTPGSTGYFDRENRMIATGDAIGSAYVWAHFGLVTQYAATVRHLQDVLRPYPHVDVLPAHFYQIKQGARGKPPLNGRPLDKQYVDDQLRVAEGILSGTVVGEPYRTVGRNATIGTVDSAQTVYTLASLYPGGVFASTGDRDRYHAVAIPGPSAPTTAPAGPYAAIDRIKAGLFLIRDYANDSLYLVVGSRRALLVGTGSGTPGVAEFASRLAGSVPVDVVVTSDDPGQVGGLAQFPRSTLYLPAGVVAPAAAGRVERVGAGSRIDLGADRAGRPLVLEVHPLTGHSPSGITLLSVSDRVLFSGDALGTQGNDAGLILRESVADFATAFGAWRAATDGRYDVLYTAHNYQWFTAPAYVDQIQAAVARGLAEGDAALVPSVRMPGSRMIRSTGGNDIVASVVVTGDR